MELTKLIQVSFDEGIKLKSEVRDQLLPVIAAAGERMAGVFASGNKIMSCGNGGSASDAEHLVAELVGRFKLERPGLPAIALNSNIVTLTAVANDYGYQSLFARQVQALGRKGDLLVAISTSGNSPNVVQAVEQAHKSDLQVIALTGNNGGRVGDILRETDLEIRVPSPVTARIQELHIVIIHCLCELIEHLLLAIKFEEKT